MSYEPLLKTNVWVGIEPNPDDRLQLCLCASDRDKIDALPFEPSDEVACVRDLRTGKRYVLRRAACGLHCYCALEVVRVN